MEHERFRLCSNTRFREGLARSEYLTFRGTQAVQCGVPRGLSCRDSR